MIRAVTFDFWDTLVDASSAAATRDARRERLLTVFDSVGVTVASDDLDAALIDIRNEFDRKWAANEQYTGWDASARLITDLGLDHLDASARDDIARRFMGYDDARLPTLTPNIEATLRRLKAEGVALGIICDVGLSPSEVLRSHLDRHGVLSLFDHWSFSDDVGVYKPDPRIFEHAARGLGDVSPEESAHVGDLRRTDVAGALGVGWTAVRYAGSNDDVVKPGEGDRSMAVIDDDAPEAPFVIMDHADLPKVLGFD